MKIIKKNRGDIVKLLYNNDKHDYIIILELLCEDESEFICYYEALRGTQKLIVKQYNDTPDFVLISFTNKNIFISNWKYPKVPFSRQSNLKWYV